VCVGSERLPIRESDVAGLAAAKVIIDGAHQTLATNPSSMYGSRTPALLARFSVCPVCGLWMLSFFLLAAPGRL